jgi:tungstate transport system substrate-binding protein
LLVTSFGNMSVAMLKFFNSVLSAAAFALLGGQPSVAQDFITIASTTSTENSGLFDHILPLFQVETGITVRVVSQGTGQALETGRRGDADIVFVHAREQEEKFVADGFGVQRVDVMYNDFVFVGPKSDPAGLRAATDAVGAMAAIAAAGVPFASRGDDSGTHEAEKALWAAAGIDPVGNWYLSTGSGMGATLNTAAQVPAYALTDRGTWLSFSNRGTLDLLFDGDPALFNPYGIILVNPERHPHVKVDAAQMFIDWIVSDQGQAAIASFAVNGQQLFFPNTR